MYTAPLEGAVASIGILLAWLFLPVPFAFIVAQTGIVALLTPTLSPLFALVELGAVGLLVVDGAENGIQSQSWLAGAAVAVLCLVLGWGTFVTAGLLGRVLTVAGVAGLLIYGLHRFEKVQLGLVEELD